MSSFNLKLEYPEVNYNKYEPNDDGTAKCPSYWIIDGDDFERYDKVSTNVFTVEMLQGESLTIPFSTGYIESVETKTFTFYNKIETSINYDDYMIQVTFSDDTTDYENLYFSYSTIRESKTFNIPSNSDYIKFDFTNINTEQSVLFYTDFEVDILTSNFDINTEQNNPTVVLNNKVARTIDNTLIATSIKDREVYYKSEIIIKNSEEIELNELVELSRQNKLLVSVNIDITDEAGNNLANIPSGGSDNEIKYWYLNHTGTRITGIYAYITLNYKLNNESNIYI